MREPSRTYRTATELNAALISLYGSADDKDSTWAQLLNIRSRYLVEKRISSEPPYAKDYAVAWPLLAHASEAYAAARCRVLMIGRETNGWADSDGTNYPGSRLPKVVPFMDASRAMKVAGEWLMKPSMTPFWRAAFRLRDCIQEADQGPAGLAWLNAFRMDEDTSTPSPAFAERLLDSPASCDLLRREIAILEPDIIWIAAGPEARLAIERQLPELADLDYSTPDLRRNLPLASLVVSSYHPQYLYRSKAAEGLINRIVETFVEVRKDG